MKKFLNHFLLFILGAICLLPFINTNTMNAQRNFQLSCNKIFGTSEKIIVQYYDYTYRRKKEVTEENNPTLYMALYQLKDPKVLFNGQTYNGQLWAKDETLKEAKLLESWKDEDFFLENNYYRQDIRLDPLSAGVYVLEVIKDNYVSQVPIFVSDYGIISRSMGNEIVAYVFDRERGNIQKDYELCVLQEAQDLTAESYKNGVAYFKIRDMKEARYLPIIAEKNGQFVPSQTYLNWYYYQQNNALKGYVFSDRSAYRPGQTVNFKGIFRRLNGFEHEVIEGDTITCMIRGPQYGEIFKQDFLLDKDGAFSASLELEEETKLGTYTISWQLKGNQQRRYYNYGNGQYQFSVEEYKKPEYEVLVNLDKPQYTVGDEIKADIEARYFFGAPVANAQVTYKVMRENYHVPWYYRFRCHWWYEPYYTYNNNQEVVDNGTAEIGEDGKLSITYKTDKSKEQNFRYTIIAEIQDASRRTITGSSSVIVAHSEFTLTAQSEKYYYHPDEKIKIRVGASDYVKNPVQTQFTAHLKGGRNYYYYKKEEKRKTLKTIQGETDPKTGETFIEFDAPETGHYTIEIEATDSRGNTTRTRTYAYILNEDDKHYRWWSQNAGQIQIMTDKKVYMAGDPLKAMIYLPDEADALVTVNGQALEYYDALKFKKKSRDEEGLFREINLDINDKAYGTMNIYACYVKNGQIYQYTQPITIIPQNRFLEVELAFDESEYKPRTTATAIVKVTDENGKGVLNANVTLSTADESIYFLYPDKTPDIRKAFFDQRGIYERTEMGNFNSYNQAKEMNPEALLWRKAQFDLELSRGAFVPNGQWHKFTYLNKEVHASKEEKLMISGFVIDYDTGKPLENVTITIGENTFKTDENGFYAIKGFVKGKKDISFVQNDNKVIIENLTFVDDNDVLLNVALKEGKEEIIELPDMPDSYLLTEDGNLGIGGVQEERLEAVTVAGTRSSKKRRRIAKTSAMKSAPQGAMGGADADDGASYFDKAEVLQQPTVRTKFEDAIYWNPNVTTDSNGEAKIQIQLPDNLTTWRTTAKVITPTTQVGQTQAKVVVTKNLLVRMETPRFINVGDNLVIATNIHNYLDNEKKVKVQLMANGLVLENTEKDITVAANGEQRIDWEVEAKWITDAKLTVKALTNEESDAMELEVPVQPYGLEILEAESLALQDEQTQNFTIEIPRDIDLTTATLELNAAPSVTSALLSSMDQLIGYPYGCVEQTMSRFLPTVVVANTLESLGQNYETTISKAELQKMVAQGYKRLKQLQHNDGGWGWWQHDGSHPFMTAYVMNGLYLSKKAGFAIDESVYKRALHAFANQVKQGQSASGRDGVNDKETTLAYQMMVAMNIGLTELWNPDLPRGSEGPYAQALWLQAAVLAKDDFVQKVMIERLEKGAIREGTSTYWGGKKFYYRWQDDRVETTANVIKALSMVDVQHKDLPNAIQWILKQRKGNSWHNTRQTAMTIYGLQEIIKNEVNPNMELEIYVNGNFVNKRKVTNDNVFEKATTFKLTGERYYASADDKIDLEKYDVLKSGNNTIEVRQTGKGTHYINTKLTYFAAGEQLEKYQKHKPIFEVKRKYYKLIPEQSNQGLVYDKKPIDRKDIKSGDNIFVEVSVKSDKDQDYVLIEDPIPAGCEFIKDTDSYILKGNERQPQGRRRGRRAYRSYWNHWYTHREYRDEHLALTVTKFNAGTYDYSYMMKAQIPGEYQVKPTLVQLMYYTENRGYSDFAKVKIK